MLMEVLVSVLILTVGLMAVLGAFSTSVKIITASRKYQTALHLAEQKMFEIMNTPFDDLDDSDRGEFGEDYPNFSWHYEVQEESSDFEDTDTSYTIDPEKYRIYTVSVSYVEKGKTFTPVTITTLDTDNLRYIL